MPKDTNDAEDLNAPDPALDPALTEDRALALLERKQLSSELIEQLSKRTNVLQSQKVRVALVMHPHTPRRMALKLLRQLYTFDLMRLALLPVLAGDLKRVADDVLVGRLTSITLGERISLARRGSPAIAAALLLDKEARVLQTALENPRLTEAAVLKTIALPAVPANTIAAVCRHSKWSVRREIRIALLRNPKTPLARALDYARSLSGPVLRDLLHGSDLPEKVRGYLRKQLEGS